MKEIILKIRTMPKEELDKYDKGRWRKAYQISVDDFKHYWNISPAFRIGDIIEKIKQDLKEL